MGGCHGGLLPASVFRVESELVYNWHTVTRHSKSSDESVILRLASIARATGWSCCRGSNGSLILFSAHPWQDVAAIVACTHPPTVSPFAGSAGRRGLFLSSIRVNFDSIFVHWHLILVTPDGSLTVTGVNLYPSLEYISKIPWIFIAQCFGDLNWKRSGLGSGSKTSALPTSKRGKVMANCMPIVEYDANLKELNLPTHAR